MPDRPNHGLPVSTGTRSRLICPSCGATGSRVKVRRGDVWRQNHGLLSLRILHPDMDGAVVEHVGAEERDGRFAISYRDLAAYYCRRTR